jgi:NADH-quinone oxidoreductase subunit J
VNAKRFLFWLLGAAIFIGALIFMASRVIEPAALSNPPHVKGSLGLPDVLFFALAALAVSGAAAVALARNILHSALGLLLALLGAGGIYVYLSADFVAVAQLLIYVGGVLILVLFAIMLTSRITEVTISNTSFGLAGGVALFIAVAPVLLTIALVTPWAARDPGPLLPSTVAIGNGLLTRWLLPFEVASLVLLATLIGAVVMARKEIKAD